MAAKNPAFSHPHRVLKSGGFVPDGWRDDEGRGPEECRRRLEAEGIRFADDAADHACFVGWEELRALLDGKPDETE